eukprot:UC4_evm1s1065
MLHRSANNTPNGLKFLPSLPKDIVADIKERMGASSGEAPYDPNRGDCEAMEWWLKFVDTQTQAHLILFDSVQHLITLVKETLPNEKRLKDIHIQMRKHQDEESKKQAIKASELIINKIGAGSCGESWLGVADSVRSAPQPTLRSKEEVIFSEIRDLVAKNMYVIPEANIEDNTAQSWLQALDSLVTSLKINLNDGKRQRKKALLLQDIIKLVRTGFCLDCPKSGHAYDEKLVANYLKLFKDAFTIIKQILNPETYKILKRVKEIIGIFKNRLTKFTLEKSNVLIDSLEKAGANFKDYANLGALLLNVAREADLYSVSKDKAKEVLILSHKASKYALDLMPSNVISMDNMAVAARNLKSLGVEEV